MDPGENLVLTLEKAAITNLPRLLRALSSRKLLNEWVGFHIWQRLSLFDNSLLATYHIGYVSSVPSICVLEPHRWYERLCTCHSILQYPSGEVLSDGCWALFVLLFSALVYYRPTELILSYVFQKFCDFTGLYFVVINPCVLSAKRVDFQILLPHCLFHHFSKPVELIWDFLFHKFP